MAYSTNGTNAGTHWTAVSNTTFGTNAINGIVWGGAAGQEKFFALGNSVSYSANGTAWTSIVRDSVLQNISAIRIVYGGAAGEEKFLVAGFGKMAYSTDCTTWTAVSNTTFNSDNSNNGENIRGIAWGGGKFVAVGNRGRMAYSTDGVTWTAVSDSTFSNNNSGQINGIAWGGGKFVAVGANGKAAYSTDGITWTAVDDTTFGSTSTTNTIMSIAWGGPSGQEKFVAGSISGKMAYWDGVVE